ncbi:YciI family protein [Amycolatopsis anabasis]|uniref:YciI family protein n=1 Tax=Amycolatopsis anabasis TaxID=1840409 RepID=UPI001C55115B|nr:YciI family protein [Amycolatopsis anabasis]
MRYVLMIGGEEIGGPPSVEVCGREEVRAWIEEVERRGMYRGGELLHPSSDATTVRVRDGEVLRTDGPFAETKEQVGGLCLLECADLDEALEIASRHPVARFGVIEVRPVWEA